jgi:tripartite-type tricarboxylate transporter receptor subunit TctC
MTRKQVLVALVAAFASVLPPGMSLAQDYPSKPLRMIAQFSPGSSGDAIVRVLATHMQPSFGHPIVIETRSGAGGVQAAEAGARAAPDGYTVLAITPAVPVIRVAAGTPISIDPTRDLHPLTTVAVTPAVIVAHPSVPVASFAELIEYAKKNPNKLSYSTTGVGSPHHLAAEQVRLLSGATMVHVPYKGGVASLADLVAGRIEVSYVILGDATPLIRSGKVRLLAGRETRRLRQFPDAPTFNEVVPGFEPLPSWTAIFTPPGVAQPIRTRLFNDITRAAKVPEAVERMQAAGFEVILNANPEEFAPQVRREIELVQRVAKSTNIKLE